MRPWLLCVALRSEALPLLAAARATRRLGTGARAGCLAGRPVVVLRVGVGPDRAAARTAAFLPGHPVAGVLSVGTCGALVEGLGVGAVVAATGLEDEDGWSPPALLTLPHVGGARVLTVRRPVLDPVRRAGFAAAGHEACDMEAAGVARAAVGLPFGVLKVVSDLAGAAPGDPLPDRRLGSARFAARATRLVARSLLPTLRAALGDLP